MSTNEIQRRNRLDLSEPAELAIRKAVDEVEKIGADVRLTKAINLLHKARELVADFIDGKPYVDLIDKPWIPDSMPPEKGKRVLVCRHSGEITTGRYTSDGWYIYHLVPTADSNPAYVKADPVTHWMELPKPYDSGGI